MKAPGLAAEVDAILKHSAAKATMTPRARHLLEEVKRKASGLAEPEPKTGAASSADWRYCRHRFEAFFGPIMKCVHCGATVAASVDGQPRDIWSPNDLALPPGGAQEGQQ